VLDHAADVPGADMVAVGASSPARGLLELAEERSARAVVVGRGGVACQLLNGAPCTVAVTPEGAAADDDAPMRTVAVAFDGSRQSRHALEAAVCLIARADARVDVVGVAPDPPPLPEGPPALAARLRGELEDRVAAALQGIPETVRGSATVVSGDPVDGIVAASDGADLLVCGSRR
jgi:nucleotide-binding universal stress UspA family protein